MRKTLITACAFASCLVVGGAFAQEGAPAKPGETAKGAALVDARGMTLYTFDRDEGGKSACVGDCAKLWPPLAAGAGAAAHGGFTLVSRGDGALQWAYKGKPLYRFAQDAKPGDAAGDGFKSVWRVAKP
ncbi:hypothetical protein [Methylocella sp.]|uniref:hypothetical protein n=1 Tax=Methylocella sp. TaxID=1978226 RepID=UPI0037851F6A